MKRKFLEDMGLTKEQVDSILDENSQDIGKAKGDLDAVQQKLNTANQEITSLKGQVADRDGQLETLKNSTGDIEALKQQIATLQSDNAAKDTAHANEIKQLKVDSAITAALTAAKAVNVKAVKALLELGDIDKIELADDGTIKGLDEKIKALQSAEDSKMLFTTEAKPKMKGAAPGETGKEEPDGKVDISKMSYEELAAYMEQNPDAQI